MNDASDLSDTILAKSDQLNACDLFSGPIVVTVQRVDKVGGDQPIIIHIDGGLQPFKPCLGMRRVLVKLWGKIKEKYIGRSIELFCEDEAQWAGQAVGGVRISGLSHINGQQSVVVRASKHKTKTYIIKPLTVEQPPQVDIAQLKLDAETNAAGGIDALQEWWGTMDKPSQKAMKPFLEEYKKKALDNQ
jgi:hypothetical protein